MKPYWQDSHRTLYQGDCRSMAELPDGSIQCVVTSPPYWGLRKYSDNQDLIWGGDNHHEHVWGKELYFTINELSEEYCRLIVERNKQSVMDFTEPVNKGER